MSEISLYMHAGSGNHGCEAIVDSLVRMMPVDRFTLMTNSAAEDEKYLPAEVKARTRIVEEQHLADHVAAHAFYYALRKVTGDEESFLRYRFRALTGKNAPKLAVSIGGDNYCYPIMTKDLMLANSMLCRQGTKTVLLGCSIERCLLQGLLGDVEGVLDAAFASLSQAKVAYIGNEYILGATCNAELGYEVADGSCTAHYYILTLHVGAVAGMSTNG
mgnify:CR=1 FL=1